MTRRAECPECLEMIVIRKDGTLRRHGRNCRPGSYWCPGSGTQVVEQRASCPTCGSPVRVVTTDEGTSHYEPLIDCDEEETDA